MAAHTDKIKGGLADKKKPKDFDAKSLKEGTKVELEHTSERGVAQEIAMDHLTEDKKYYKKLKEVEKFDVSRIEITPDGKTEIVEGKESLKKDPKEKKKLKDRWDSLKKALDHNEAFMDIAEQTSSDEEQQPEETEQPQEPQVPVIPGSDQEGQEEQQPEEMEQQEAQPQEDEAMNQQGQEELNPEADQEELIEALKQEGYTDPEIAFIVHGHHSPEIDPTAQAKAEATAAMSGAEVDNARQMAELDRQHKASMADHELNHRKRMSDLEYEGAKMSHPDPNLEKEHRKRMLDLEYEKARLDMPDSESDKEANKQLKQIEVEKKKLELEAKKQQIQLEIEFRKKEHELKLKQMEAMMRQQAKQKGELASEKHKQKLADTKSLKKTDEEEYEQEESRSDAE